MKRRTLFSLGLFAATLSYLNCHATNLSEKLRAISCDLSTLPLQSPGDASQNLKSLLDKADPDVILLQGAPDWETCERICKLRPGLRVITCSSFPAQPITAIAPQVAILAREKAVLSWVENLSSSNGFAFAMLQAGQRKLAIFSIQSKDASPATTDKVLAEIKKLQSYAKNRPDSFLIGGSLLAKTTLASAGFENIAADPAQGGKVTHSEFWASNAGFLSRPRSFAVAGISQPLLIADFDSSSSFSSKLAHQNALLFPGESPAPIPAIIQPQPLRLLPIALTVVATLGVFLISARIFRRRQQPSLALVPLDATNDPALAQPRLDEQTRSNLLTWFKSIFMQRLLSQRQQMIAEQSEATRRTLAIEEKIGQLQDQLQDRITAYESRIGRLETELSAATFENRDLIRNQIELLKEKVAKAKEEVIYHRN
jgi:hypothetical protein